jgi:hypothetical protein
MELGCPKGPRQHRIPSYTGDLCTALPREDGAKGTVPTAGQAILSELNRRLEMRTYLRIINPIVAVIVLALCVYAATCDERRFKPDGLLEGGIPTYFLAKGLFCSSTLFILGRVLLSMMAACEDKREKERTR